MRYQDGYRLLETARDQIFQLSVFLLEFVGFRECFVVVS